MAHMKLGKRKVLTRTKREWARVNSVNLVPELFILPESSALSLNQPCRPGRRRTLYEVSFIIIHFIKCASLRGVFNWYFNIYVYLKSHFHTQEQFSQISNNSGTRNLKYSWGRVDTPCVHICHCTSLTKRPFVVTHTIRQTAIPTLLDSWVTNTSSVQMIRPRKLPFLIVS
jgi:hypothetical protein